MSITAELKLITQARETLDTEQARLLMSRLLDGQASEVQLAALLGALAARGESAEEIAGFALALRDAAIPLPLTEEERADLVDSCGTGGDGSGTFNISTGAALVAAAAGARVAKHGNRAVTSRCGSADVLEALGLRIEMAPGEAAAMLRAHGFCFLLAPAYHPGLRATMPVRRGLGVRTIFNVLGPLLNPAGARRQLMGVYSDAVLRPVAEAMPLLGMRRALVVHGAGGLDEISLAGATQAVRVVSEAGTQTAIVEALTIEPKQLGLAGASLEALAGGESAEENAALLRRVFAGERGPRRDAVLANAAAVLTLADRAPDLVRAVGLAAEAIDSGRVTRLVSALAC